MSGVHGIENQRLRRQAFWFWVGTFIFALGAVGAMLAAIFAAAVALALGLGVMSIGGFIAVSMLWIAGEDRYGPLTKSL